MVNIFVGTPEPAETTFTIPASVLVNASDYFTDKITALQQTSAANTIKLTFPDDDKEAWEILLYFLYNGEVPDIDPPGAVLAHNRKADYKFVKAWVLGERYQLPDLQDNCMWDLLHRAAKGLSFEVLELGCHKTPPGSVMRKLMAEQAVGLCFDEQVIDEDDLRELALRFSIEAEIEAAEKRFEEEEEGIYDRFATHVEVIRKCTRGAQYRPRTGVPGRWTEFMVQEYEDEGTGPWMLRK